MTLLFLSYLLGYQKGIRKGVRAVLWICCVLTAGYMLVGPFATPATFAADDEETVEEGEHGASYKNPNDEEHTLITEKKNYTKWSVVSLLEEVLEAEDETYDMLDKGLNLEFLELIQKKLESYSTASQADKFATITEGLDDISSDILKTQWNLEKDELLEVMEYIVEMTEDDVKKDTATPSSDTSSKEEDDLEDMGTYGISYKIVDVEDDKKLVQFMFPKAVGVKRMNRHFGDGTTYSCERNQCARIHHIYEKEDTYEIMIFATTRHREGWKETIELNPWSNLATMLTKKAQETDTEDKETTTTKETVEDTSDDEENGTDEEVSDEEVTDEDIAEELDFIKDLLGIDFE